MSVWHTLVLYAKQCQDVKIFKKACKLHLVNMMVKDEKDYFVSYYAAFMHNVYYNVTVINMAIIVANVNRNVSKKYSVLCY